MENDSRLFLSNLNELLNDHFNLDEIKGVCFELDLDFDSLQGEAKGGKTRELIQLLARQDNLPNLLGVMKTLRPNTEWPNIPPNFSYSPSQSLKKNHSSTTQTPTFNLGNINAGAVNLGGEQSISGPISVDLRQVETNQKPKLAARQNSQFKNIKQLISHSTDRSKAPLFHLIEDLLFELEDLQDKKTSQRILSRLEALILELNEDPPDQELIQISGQNLKRAANKISTDQSVIKQLIGQCLKLIAIV